MVKKILIIIIGVYQKTLSPDHGFFKVFFPNGLCRFHPTCSEYAREAINRYGAIRGTVLAARRLSRCHPFNQGGLDPVT